MVHPSEAGRARTLVFDPILAASPDEEYQYARAEEKEVVDSGFGKNSKRRHDERYAHEQFDPPVKLNGEEFKDPTGKVRDESHKKMSSRECEAERFSYRRKIEDEGCRAEEQYREVIDNTMQTVSDEFHLLLPGGVLTLIVCLPSRTF